MGLFTRAPTPQRSLLASAVRPAPTAPALPLRSAVTDVRHGPPRPLTAAARQIDVRSKDEVEHARALRTGDDWQTRAWDYYDAVGEIKYAANLIGKVTSRLRLYPAVTTSYDQVPTSMDEVEDLPEGLLDTALEALAALGTCHGGQSGALKDLALNLFVAGEANLVELPEKIGSNTPRTWQIASVDELVPLPASRSSRGGEPLWALKSARTTKDAVLTPLDRGAAVCRIWSAHPRYSTEADSSLLGLLDPIEQLLLLQRAVRGTARSRLNAGLLYLPDGVSIAGGTGGDGEPPAPVDSATDPAAGVAGGGVDDGGGVFAPLADDSSEDIAEALIDAMSAPIADESAASSVVPLILRGPDDLGDKIRHLSFERSFDEQLTQQADRLLDRILAGLDLPKDIVSGMANVRYSNLVQIEESLWKAHIEPLALLICDALTFGFLRPWLRAAGFTAEQAETAVLWYDPSSVTTKPGLAEAATDGYDKRIISADAWRKYNGFAEGDRPDPVEIAQRIAVERGPLSEPVTEALFRLLIPNLMERARQNSQDASAAPVPDSVERLINPAATRPSVDDAASPAPPTSARPAPQPRPPATTGPPTGDDPLAEARTAPRGGGPP